MNLFEVFRQKQVKITPEVTVNVEYITVGSIADIYARASGDVLLVKRQLTAQDITWLREYHESYTVFTTEPETLEALDAQKVLADTAGVHIIERIGLNFLHFGEELYAFPDIMDGSPAPGTPNVVLVHPAHRSDVETQLAINLDMIKAAMGIGGHESIPTGNVEESDNTPSDLAGRDKGQEKEIALVRAELATRFAERYSVLRVRFSGSKPENRTVGLTEFYAKHKIAKGKLRGTWSLFHKADLDKIMDAGIVDQAKEAVLSKISVSIPGYDMLIRAKDVAGCRLAMEKIESDYKAYLDGKPGCTHVGEIKIAIAFSPMEALEATFMELRDYLLSLRSPWESEYAYEDAVDSFLARERYKHRYFSDGVKMMLEETAYKASQWESQDFILSLWRAIEKNPDFFDSDIVALLKRYTRLINRQGQP